MGNQIKLGPPYLYELNVAKGKAHPKTIAAPRKLAPTPPPPPSESESEDYEHYSDTDSSGDLERTLLIHASDWASRARLMLSGGREAPGRGPEGRGRRHRVRGAQPGASGRDRRHDPCV